MNRALACFVLLGGCASGGGGNEIDAAPGHDAAPRDASSGAHDARPTDARLADARPIDASTVGCTPVAVEHLVNGALDQAPDAVGWTQLPITGIPGGPFPIITSDGPAAQSPGNLAWLGGASGTDVVPQKFSVTDQLYQEVTIPAMTTQVTISGYYAAGTTETTTTTVYDTLSVAVVQTNGTQLESVLALTNLSATPTWTAFSKTLTTDLSGMTVRLRATSTNDITQHSNFFLDSLSLKATHCP